MQQLTGMDAAFLALETANTTGHVGGLSVLDPSTASGPLTLARLTRTMAERLPLVPDIDQLAGYLPEELALLAKAAEKRAAEQPAS